MFFFWPIEKAILILKSKIHDIRSNDNYNF